MGWQHLPSCQGREKEWKSAPLPPRRHNEDDATYELRLKTEPLEEIILRGGAECDCSWRQHELRTAEEQSLDDRWQEWVRGAEAVPVDLGRLAVEVLHALEAETERRVRRFPSSEAPAQLRMLKDVRRRLVERMLDLSEPTTR